MNVLLRWGVGVVDEGSAPGGAAGGTRLGVLRVGERRVTSRGHVCRETVPVTAKRSAVVRRRPN